jgi:DNA polymerase-1
VLDTIVMAHLFWPEIKWSDDKLIAQGKLAKGLRGKYSLEAFGQRLGEWKGDYTAWCKEQGLDPWAEWRPEMQSYCEQDVRVTVKLWFKCRARWQDVGGTPPVPFSDRSVALEHRVAAILARQERHGFRFNEKKAEQLYLNLIEIRAKMEAELKATMPPWQVRTPFTPKANNKKLGYVKGVPTEKVKVVEFNPSSRRHVSKLLIEKYGWRPEAYGKDGVPTVDDEVLAALPWPEAKKIALYFMVQKRIGHLAEGKAALMKAVKKNGRIHGRVEPNGAVTGRMTHSNPPMAGNPKVKVDDEKNVIYGPDGGFGYEFRELFEVDPGYTLVGCDADSLEGRCLAGYLQPYDRGAFIETLLRGDKKIGTDLHSVNALALGLDPKKVYSLAGTNSSGRELAKTWFYAFLYGAGDGSLGLYLPGGDKRSDKQNRAVGKKARATFLANLPALGKLVEQVQKKTVTRGFLIGLDGRKIFTRSKHSALNTLLQGAGAAIMKEALVILDDALRARGLSPERDYEFCANIHDEWQIEVKDEQVETVKELAADAIRQAGESLNFKCPLAGNPDAGRNWAETH